MAAATQSFTVKQLRFTFTLANSALFAGTNSNVLQVTGLRASVKIKASGLPAFPEADITVYGLKESDMISLTCMAFEPLGMQRNSVTVEANSGYGWSTVFVGQIITGGPNYDQIPAACLKVCARVLGYESLGPANPTSYTDATSVASIMQSLAARMGYAFENNGVASSLNNPYFAGTLAEQLRSVAAHAGIDVYIEGNVIAICPKGAPRNQSPFVLTPQSGLVGYPQFDYQRGFVRVTSLYSAAFRFGGPLTLAGSELTPANGKYVIGTLCHTLESLMLDGGDWFSDLLLYPPNSIPPIQ